MGLLTEGAITLVQYGPSIAGGVTPCRGFGGFSWFDTYSANAGYVYLQLCTDPVLGPALAAHELGHSLGWAHVAAAQSVMTTTVTGDVTEFDRQATAIAFGRPPGNRAPDVDPEVSVNAAPARFGGRTRVVGPIP